MAKKKPAAKTKPPTDWVAVLKSGAPGVKKWNKLTGRSARRSLWAAPTWAART